MMSQLKEQLVFPILLKFIEFVTEFELWSPTTYIPLILFGQRMMDIMLLSVLQRSNGVGERRWRFVGQRHEVVVFLLTNTSKWRPQSGSSLRRRTPELHRNTQHLFRRLHPSVSLPTVFTHLLFDCSSNDVIFCWQQRTRPAPVLDGDRWRWLLVHLRLRQDGRWRVYARQTTQVGHLWFCD